MQNFTQRASEVLFSSYQRFRGKTCYEICMVLNVPIVVDQKLNKRQAFLYGSSKGEFIKIPHFGAPFQIIAYWLSYHELAHLFLLRDISRVGFLNSGREYWIVEYWCDSFATVMIFARLGIVLAPTVSEMAQFIDASEDFRYFEDETDNIKQANRKQVARLRTYLEMYKNQIDSIAKNSLLELDNHLCGPFSGKL